MTEPLTVTKTPTEDHQLDLNIQVGPERTEQALQKAAKQLAKKRPVPGFRPGKAPYSAVLRAFGREALLNEVVDDLGQEVYKEVLDSEKLEPYSQAALVDVEMDPLTFKLRVPLQPAVDLKDYRSVRVEEPALAPVEGEVDEYLEQQRSQRATWTDIDRAAQMGDMVLVDIKGTVGDDTIMDNQDWELILKEEGGWLPGFDEAFVGMREGDTKTFTLTYPEDSQSRYKGQEATFEVTVKKVRANLMPEVTDEFAATLGEYENLEDLRTKLSERISSERKNEAEAKFNDAALKAVIDQASLSYPPALVDEQLHEMLHDMEHRLSRIGYKLEDYLRLQGTTIAAYAETLRPQAEERAKQQLVLRKLSELEGIAATPEDIDAEAEKILGAGGSPEQSEQMRQLLYSDNGRALLERDVITQKTLARLREIARGEAPELPAAGADVATEAPAGEERGEAEQEEGEPTVEAPTAEPSSEA